MPNKTSLTLRSELEKRGIDLLEMQLAIYNKAMSAFDERRGCTDGYEGDEDNPPSAPKDTGAAYLAVANQAVGTLARYCYPTMSAVKVESSMFEERSVMKTMEAIEIIKNDPFAANVS